MIATITSPDTIAIESKSQIGRGRSWLVNIGFAEITPQFSKMEVTEVGSSAPHEEFRLILSKRGDSDPWDVFESDEHPYEEEWRESHVVHFTTNCDRHAFILRLVEVQFPGWEFEGLNPLSGAENEF